jgi:hypothetical protein
MYGGAVPYFRFTAQEFLDNMHLPSEQFQEDLQHVPCIFECYLWGPLKMLYMSPVNDVVTSCQIINTPKGFQHILVVYEMFMWM